MCGENKPAIVSCCELCCCEWCCGHGAKVRLAPHRSLGRESHRRSHQCNNLEMRITLPSGTTAEIARPVGTPSVGLVVAPDIFGLRPLYDEMVERWAREWGVAVAAVEPFPGKDFGADIEPRFAAVHDLNDEDHLRDLLEAADALATPTVVLIGFCMGGMYCFKAARSDRFARIASFYGMISVPDAWASPTQGEPLD